MKWNWQRVTLAIVDGFAALSAFGGGYAVMAGLIQPGVDLAGGPLSWLIRDYFVAGEILFLVVGGSALAAFVATFVSRPVGAGFSGAAGLVMMGWIAGEVVLVGASSWLQVVYFALGLGMLGLSLLVEPVRARAIA